MFKKVLALDCDGTLWDGVAGEDGSKKVKPFKEFQRSLLKLPEQGILLVLVSKNNEEDIWEVFEKNPNMILRREDIVAHRINWQEKSENLKELADELNLGLDSFVFWDDNLIEREKVRQNSEAIVPNIPKDVSEWTDYVLEEFYCDEITEEDRKRVAYYRANAKFKTEKTRAKNEMEFLASIKMRVFPVKISDKKTLERAEQLCQKTNQFNLRTKRHAKNEIKKIAGNAKNTAFLIGLKDKYGEHGNVGLVMATATNLPAYAFLDTFLMSCRVMQRHLESWMLRICAKELEKKGIEYLVGEYIPSKRNGMTATFFEKHGMEKIESPGKGLKIKKDPKGILYIGETKKIIDHTKIYTSVFNKK